MSNKVSKVGYNFSRQVFRQFMLLLLYSKFLLHLLSKAIFHILWWVKFHKEIICKQSKQALNMFCKFWVLASDIWTKMNFWACWVNIGGLNYSKWKISAWVINLLKSTFQLLLLQFICNSFAIQFASSFYHTFNKSITTWHETSVNILKDPHIDQL